MRFPTPLFVQYYILRLFTFRFREDICLKSLNFLCPRSQGLSGHGILGLGKP